MAGDMIDARTIKGLGVVSIESGAKLGTVDDVLFDTKGLRLAALHIKADRQEAIIPFSEVASVGENAVTVPGDMAARWGASGGELGTLPTLNDVKKLKVVDEAGTLIGTIDDVCVAPDGSIAEIKVHKGGVLGVGGESHRIPASVITSVGDEVIVVPARQATP
jgi:uncharacterized protein YrrD